MVFKLYSLKNHNLNNQDRKVDQRKLEADARELKKNSNPLTSSFFLDSIIKEYSKEELRQFFSVYQSVSTHTIFQI